MYRFTISLLASCIFLLPTFASNIVVLPQENSGSTTGYIYSPEPFTQLGTFNVDPTAFQVIWHPNGQKFYTLSKSLNKSIAIFSGSSPYAETASRALGGVSTGKISPDGRRLFILAAGVVIYETSGDQEITRVNTCGDTSCVPLDVEFSIDSSRAFVLNSNGTIVAINLGNNAIVSRLSIANASTIAAAPNGLLYVTAQNRLLEIDGRETLVQVGADIPITGANCLRPQFTPDGSRVVVACNVIGSTQIYVMDILSRSIATAAIQGAAAERMQVVSNTTALYYIGVSNVIFRGGLVSPLADPTQFELSGSGVFSGGRFFVTTDEQPSNRFLFSTTSNAISRINLESNSLSNAITQNTLVGPTFFTGRAPTGIPFSLIAINPSQNVIQSQRGRPLVVRALDSSTRPLNNVTINFLSASNAIQFDAGSVTTNKDGYATVNFTAPSVTGTYTVSASSPGSQGQTFTLNVTASPNTGGGGGTGGGTGGPQPIEIVSGNGQLVYAQFFAPQQLTVRLRDGAGNPLANANVNWEITSGEGNLAQSSTLTDTRGIAQTSISTNLFYNDGFNRPKATVIRASSVGGNSVNFTLTAYPAFGPPPFLIPSTIPNIILVSPVEGTTLRVPAGGTLAGAIKATILGATLSGFGIPMSGIGFSGTTGNDPESAPTATCLQTVQSDSQGNVSCDLVAGPKLGTAQFNACLGNCNAPGRSFTFNVEVVSGAPAVITKRQGDGQSGAPGTLTPLLLRGAVADSFGNNLSGVNVRVEILSGDATIESLNNITRDNGEFSFLVRFGSIPGEVRIRTTAGAATANWTVTNNVTVGNFVRLTGDSQSAVIGRPFATPLSVQLFDSQARPIPGAAVTFAIQSGQVTLSASSAITNSQGIATVNATAGTLAGPISVSASAVNRVVTFSLTALPPGPTLSRVANAAGFQAGLVPCGLATVFGSNFAPNLNGVVMGNTFVGPYTTRLNNVSIEVGSRTAPIVSLANLNGQEQVTFQTPCDVAPGNSTLRMQVGEGSGSLAVTVLPVQPGIFETTDSTGRRIGVVVKADGTYMTRENPAVRGEVLIGFFTGLGQTLTPTTTNNPGAFNNSTQVAAQIIIGINNEGAPVLSATMAPGLVGIYVVQFSVPDNATTGTDRPYAIGAVGSDGAYVPGNPSLIHIR
jgi:uncharacterized protein (TIGR03437 family)